MQLDERLEEASKHIMNLKFCELRLQNEDRFPWVILIPTKENVVELIDLSDDEQILLMQEISIVSRAMQEIFSPDKLNIAALGNIVKQLHIHIIARYENDAAWPNPVWGHFNDHAHYTYDTLRRRIKQLRAALGCSDI